MNNLTVISYDKEKHHDLIAGWAKRRKLQFCPALLSQQGFIVTNNNEPVLAVWVYTILGVPVIQLDNLISKPGTSAAKMRAYWLKLLSVIKDFINELDKLTGNKTLMIRCFIHKRLAKESEKSGFIVDSNDGAICRLIIN